MCLRRRLNSRPHAVQPDTSILRMPTVSARVFGSQPHECPSSTILSCRTMWWQGSCRRRVLCFSSVRQLHELRFCDRVFYWWLFFLILRFRQFFLERRSRKRCARPEIFRPLPDHQCARGWIHGRRRHGAIAKRRYARKQHPYSYASSESSCSSEYLFLIHTRRAVSCVVEGAA